MLPEYKKTTNIGVGLGFVGQILGQILVKNGSEIIGLLILLAGLATFIWGCGQYAKAKGFSAWFGALGFLNIIGLVALFLFPVLHKALPAKA